MKQAARDYLIYINYHQSLSVGGRQFLTCELLEQLAGRILVCAQGGSKLLGTVKFSPKLDKRLFCVEPF